MKVWPRGYGTLYWALQGNKVFAASNINRIQQGEGKLSRRINSKCWWETNRNYKTLQLVVVGNTEREIKTFMCKM